MSRVELAVRFAGPHVSVQDGGRPGLMRFGVPRSGPLDRLAFAAANTALGNAADAPGIEISPGGLVLDCVAGAVSFAVAGGGFIVEHGGTRRGSWCVATLRAGQRLAIRPGPWGSWCYLALAAGIERPDWLGSKATHALSGLGGGRVLSGETLILRDPQIRTAREGAFPCPVLARPRADLRVTLGPQERHFAPETLAALLAGPWALSDAWDRMGLRLRGPRVAPMAALDIPSEPVLRGSVQVAGDGVATVLLADHQTTGGYPKIATVLGCDLDGLVRLRPRDRIGFQVVAPAQAVAIARVQAQAEARYLAALARR